MARSSQLDEKDFALLINDYIGSSSLGVMILGYLDGGLVTERTVLSVLDKLLVSHMLTVSTIKDSVDAKEKALDNLEGGDLVAGGINNLPFMYYNVDRCMNDVYRENISRTRKRLEDAGKNKKRLLEIKEVVLNRKRFKEGLGEPSPGANRNGQPEEAQGTGSDVEEESKTGAIRKRNAKFIVDQDREEELELQFGAMAVSEDKTDVDEEKPTAETRLDRTRMMEKDPLNLLCDAEEEYQERHHKPLSDENDAAAARSDVAADRDWKGKYFGDQEKLFLNELFQATRETDEEDPPLMMPMNRREAFGEGILDFGELQLRAARGFCPYVRPIRAGSPMARMFWAAVEQKEQRRPKPKKYPRSKCSPPPFRDFVNW